MSIFTLPFLTRKTIWRILCHTYPVLLNSACICTVDHIDESKRLGKVPCDYLVHNIRLANSRTVNYHNSFLKYTNGKVNNFFNRVMFWGDKKSTQLLILATRARSCGKCGVYNVCANSRINSEPGPMKHCIMLHLFWGDRGMSPTFSLEHSLLFKIGWLDT